jgi:hypothetical protein
MIVLRALFWLAVVSLFVPYKEFDPMKGEFRVDYRALNRQAHALVHVCETEPKVCEAARALARATQKEALRLAGAMVERAKEST